MADIDKSLPNVKQTINIPSPEDVEVVEQEKISEQQEAGQPIETQLNEDGSVDINFDPSIGSVDQSNEHFANLAELLPDDVLDPLGNELFNNYTDYKTSRKGFEMFKGRKIKRTTGRTKRQKNLVLDLGEIEKKAYGGLIDKPLTGGSRYI